MSADLIRRWQIKQRAESSPAMQAVTLEACTHDIESFFNDWLWTYDPRLPALNLPADIPFTLRPRQAVFLKWLRERETQLESGLVEKSRDEGASYLVLGYFLHKWLFTRGFAGAIGSRKQDLVDKIGDPKALFWKVRYMLYGLPAWFLPEGFTRKEHDNFLRLVNPKNGSTITGEAGNEMGRGGRASIYFVDEWAHIDHAQAVNAAISQNSNVRIKVFTPNGIGNLAYQERFSGKLPVFTFHWKDNPDKNYTAERVNDDGEVETYHPWYERQQKENDPLTLAQEVDIDYAASTENVVIPAIWVRAAASIKLNAGSINVSGLDVSEDGSDKTMYANRRGGVVRRVKELTGTPAQKAQGAEAATREDAADELRYDRLGVGSAITATLGAKEDLPFKVIGVSNADEVSGDKFEDQPKVPASERFQYWADEQWWALRLRFWRTYQRSTGAKHFPDDECISIPNRPSLIAQLSQPTYSKNSKDKIRVDKKGNGTASPDEAEAALYAFAKTPAPAPRRARTVSF